MSLHPILATVTSILMVAAAQADVRMRFEVNKTFYQRSPSLLDFTQGNMRVILRDGLVILAPCATHPSPFFFGPSIVCPLGATGYVAQGDVNFDGVRDDNQYWSVQSVVPALIIEPSRPELVQLFAGPASKLPRPLSNFRDDSLVTFYDISTPAVTQYDQSRYELIRNYGPVAQVETLVVFALIETPGLLDVVVSGSDIVGAPLTVQVPVTAGDFGDVLTGKIRTALQAVPAITDFYSVGGSGTSITLTELLFNGNDPTLVFRVNLGTASGLGLPSRDSENTTAGRFGSPAADAGRMREELVVGTYVFTYPRLNFPESPVAIPVTLTPIVEALDFSTRVRDGFRYTTGTWDGEYYQLDPRLINNIKWVGNSRAKIRPNDQIFFSILSPEEDRIIFPPTVPETEVLLRDPTIQSYTLPPFFFIVGDEGVMNLRYQRFLFSNGVAFDASLRNFRAKVRMVDSYSGFAPLTFPLGTNKRELAPGFDQDRDGMSNIDEYALEWPTRELLTAQGEDPDTIGFGTAAAVNPTIQPNRPVVSLDAANHLVVKASVRPLTGTSLRYAFAILDTKPKKPVFRAVKAGKDWTITKTQELEAVRIGASNLTLPHDFVVLRSVNPVADPGAPLPVFRVSVSAVAIK